MSNGTIDSDSVVVSSTRYLSVDKFHFHSEFNMLSVRRQPTPDQVTDRINPDLIQQHKTVLPRTGPSGFGGKKKR